ncbi:hypothetical protein A0H81_03803 [Grifola frondosa]|uniref:Uncharacterized protein n=1 Tax=Grifola frondosa TaxID=5627 RepID=A0A1C7MJB3_GRIFR|nr:hypothetical protein A0H81_03803 [Grifola frondosa]
MYPDNFTRPQRHVEETPDYGMEPQSWPPSHDAPPVSYAPPPLMSPCIPMSARPSWASPFQEVTRPILSTTKTCRNSRRPPSAPTICSEWLLSICVAAHGLTRVHATIHANAARPPPPGSYYHPQHVNVAFAAIPFAPPPMVPKRSMEPVEEEQVVPKPKKARKTKTTDGAVSSRRGYNAKKRNEAAQIAAQNAQLMPTVSYAHMSGDKGKEKAQNGNGQAMNTMRLVPDDGVVHPEASGPLHPELQFARCMSNRYRSEEFPRCVSCTRRWAGDTCRFQGIRFFLKNEKRDIVGISFVESQKADSPSMNFPVKWNVTLEIPHIRRIKRTVARALLPILKQELQHLALSEIIRRPRESEVRATCDTCMTSIFSSSWMCRLCGREACAECFEQVRELTVDRVGAPEAEIAALQARREKHAHINPFFLSCTRRNEHHAKDFSPMSRFCKAELTQAIDEMQAMLDGPDQDLLPPEVDTIDPSLQTVSPRHAAWPAPGSGPSSAAGVDPRNPAGTPPDPSLFASASASAASNASSGAMTPSLETAQFVDAELTEDSFRRVWGKGEPLVVTGLLPKFHVQWTPEYFKNKYGSQSCLILECQTDQNKRVTVGEFFSWFGKRRKYWKDKKHWISRAFWLPLPS